MTTRTPQDYALEHAEYMACAAERLIEAVDFNAKLQIKIAESDDVSDDEEYDSQVTVDERLRTMRERIYEFRKRHARALREQGWLPIASAPLNGVTVIVGRDMGEFGFVRGFGRFDGIPGAFCSGWICQGFMDPPGNLGLAHPTHYMPLPLPPSTKGESTNG